MKYIPFFCLILFSLSACAAKWGATHKIKFADENKFVVQYDRALTSSVRTARLADEHCAKYSKTAVPVEAKMPGLLFGIIQETFDCE